MKRLIALAVVTALTQSVATYAGEPMMSSKAVVPAPPPPPLSFFRPNEFDIGAFATYVTGTGGNPGGTLVSPNGFRTTISGDTTIDGWGGGMDFTYWTPLKYLGFRFQGAGVSLSTGTVTVTTVGPNGRFVSRNGSASASAGVISADLMLRLPLDDFWPSVHLAPYAFGGLGALFVGGNGDRGTANTPFAELNTRINNAQRGVQDRVLGVIGGGFEYRFTPHVGLFGEVGYNFIDHNGRATNNFLQTNFGLRYAF